MEAFWKILIFFPFFGPFLTQIFHFLLKTAKFQRKKAQKMEKNENLPKRLHSSVNLTYVKIITKFELNWISQIRKKLFAS